MTVGSSSKLGDEEQPLLEVECEDLALAPHPTLLQVGWSKKNRAAGSPGAGRKSCRPPAGTAAVRRRMPADAPADRDGEPTLNCIDF